MRKLFSLWLSCALAGSLCSAQSTPMSLAEMFARADSVNSSLRVSRLAVESARAGEASARNAYLPSVDLSLSLSYNGDGYITDRDFTHGFSAPIPSFGNNFRLEVSQVIYAGGAIAHGVALAGVGAEMAVFEAEKNRNEVRFLIAGDYFELCKLAGQRKVLESNIELARQLRERMSARVDNGTALPTDLTRLDLLAEKLNCSLIQLEGAAQIIGRELARALDWDDCPVLAEEEAAFLPEDTYTETAWEQAPALKLADAAVQMAAYKEKIAKAERLPQVVLFAGEYLDGPVVIDIPALDKNFNYWAVGVGIRYNLASLYKSPKNIRQSHWEWQQAQAQATVAREQLSLAVGACLTDYRNAFVLADTAARSAALAEEGYALMRYRYEEGLATMTDLLEASAQLIDARMQEVNSRIEIAYHYYKLQYITGTI